MSTNRLKGRKALVTGSGTGIGREIALEYAREGADVVFHYSRSPGGAHSGVAEAEALGVRASAVQADFNNLDDVRRLADEAVAALGGIDLLVNNAGITMNLPFEQVTPEQFDTLYRVNVRAQFFLTQRLLAPLEQARGVVINLSSVHAYQGMREHSVYAGTKGAIVSYTRELAVELATRGIRVVGLAPGGVWVENTTKAAAGQDLSAQLGSSIPCGFVALPPDIAKVAVFLATGDARYFLGQTLIVDGGTTSWLPFGEQWSQPLEAKFGKGYVPGL
ncbi:MAG: SDR family oxidoreductase [Chthoniobacterales bacterium]|nr:SDR family oxidoreductase [Chthoniobacterales bacterium]